MTFKQRLNNLNKLQLLPNLVVRQFARRKLASPTAIKDARKAEIGSLIQQIDQDNSISESDIDSLYNEHRYDGRLALRLYMIQPSASVPPPAQLQTDLTEKLASIVSKDPDVSGPSASNLRIAESDAFGDFLEIEYKYHSPLYYIDVDERLAETTETKNGFLWLHTKDQFLVILARDDRIVQPIRWALGSVIRSSPRAIKLTQDIIEDHFAENDLRRVYHQDSESGNKYSASGDYSSLEVYIANSDQTFQRTGAMYRTEVLPGVSRNVGLNARLGKIYFTRSMSTSEVRTWAKTELPSLIGDIRRWESVNGGTLTSQSERILRLRIDDEAKVALGAISDAVCRIMLGGPREMPLPFDSAFVLQKLGTQYVKASIASECDTPSCDDNANRCPKCDGRRLTITSDSVQCAKCAAQLQSGTMVELKCGYDHISNADLSDCLSVRPTRKLMKILEDELRSVGVIWQTSVGIFEISGNAIKLLSIQMNQIMQQTNIFRSGGNISNVQTGNASRMDIGNQDEED